ncbi:MAG: NAD-dependent epimerase/dehydratase family protein [Bacteroidota bacterium]|nr:NAD-dependent epimerase/dehydratase family protein [Bacteroidota bacterium]
MNILITGIHGFVGSNLVTALKIDHTVYGLDIISPQKEGVLKTFGWSDLDSIPLVDVIIHLAGKAHDTKNQTNAQVYFDINTSLTQKIYDWFLASSATKFIFFSSVKAAADRVVGEILTEDIVPSPKGPYGESKIAAENFLLKQEARSKRQEPPTPKGEEEKNQEPRTKNQEPRTKNQELGEDGELSTINCPLSTEKRTYILRPCMIHGPGNKGNLNLLYQVIKKGIPYPLGAFENRRSFTSIDNLSYVISGLIEKDIPSGIYNMGDDESLSTNELIALMAKTMNKPNRTWKWNKSLVEQCAKIGSILHLPLNTERLQKLTENYVVSNSKLKKELGITKMPVTAEEGLRKTIESFRNQ